MNVDIVRLAEVLASADRLLLTGTLFTPFVVRVIVKEAPGPRGFTVEFPGEEVVSTVEKGRITEVSFESGRGVDILFVEV